LAIFPESAFGHGFGVLGAVGVDQLALALVEAINQDSIREGSDVACSTSSKTLEGTNDERIHLGFE
jgi:hypothetical protein